MEMFTALDALLSLSQETRLRVFRLLIEYGRKGLAPGQIAEKLKIRDNTLSFHLSHMAKAGLVTSKKEGRTITYLANTDLIEDLIKYLDEYCCAREKRTKGKKKSSEERKCCDEEISHPRRR